MGTTWGPDAKNHRKSDSEDPPQEVPKEVKFEHFSILFSTVFGISFGIMFSYLLGPLGAEKVVIFIGGLFKNRLWHFLKKLPTMILKMTSFWYLVGAKFVICRVPKPMQKK